MESQNQPNNPQGSNSGSLFPPNPEPPQTTVYPQNEQPQPPVYNPVISSQPQPSPTTTNAQQPYPVVSQVSPSGQFPQPQTAADSGQRSGFKKVLRWLGIGILGIITICILGIVLWFIITILFGTGHKSAKITQTSSSSSQQVNAQAGFSIIRPAGWGNSTPAGTDVVAIYQDPQADSAGQDVAVHPAIVISEGKFGAGAPLSQIVSSVMSVYSQQPGYSLLSSRQTEVSSLPAQIEVFTFLLQGRPTTATDLIVQKGDTVYAVQAYSLSSTYSQHSSVFENALGSFKLT